MDIIIVIILSYVAVVAQFTYFRTRDKMVKAVQTTTQPKAVSVAIEHRLEKTWIGANRENNACAGWRWKCTCGVIGSAGNSDPAKNSLGSETNAIERFMNHAKLYRQANGDEWEDKFTALQKEHNDYIEKCFCKGIHTHQPLERL